MKKTFALLMAALMTASMTTVAFAKVGSVQDVKFTGEVCYDNNGDGELEVYQVENIGDVLVTGGETLYFPLLANYESEPETHDYVHVKKVSDLDRWDIAANWEVGNAEKPEFDVVKIAGERYVVLALDMPENDTTKNKELLGTIGLGYTASEAKKDADAIELNVEYGRDYTFINEELKSFDGYFPKGYENGAVVNFKGVDDEIDIEFGDMALFTVDVTGQGKLDLRFDTKYNADFNEMYEYANIEYLNFKNNPIFNRNGVMYIYADEDMYLYEVTEDGAKEVEGAEYDEDEGAFVFKTRTLKSYAISDEELDTVDEIADGEIVVEKPENAGKPNPDTGR